MTKTTPPPRRRVVHDTDAFNEVDDQYALAHLLLSSNEVVLEAAYAAPFYLPELNRRADNPGDGMEKSYQEIIRVIEFTGRSPTGGTFRGARSYLSGPATPVESDAAHDLIKRALASTPADPLYVCATGAITNVASALLLEPKIAKNIVIVWLGGHAFYWPDTREFNLMEDVHATRVVLNSCVPLVHIPCLPIASHLTTTVAELQAELAPYSRIGAYLTNIVRDFEKNVGTGYAKPIWDIAASAYVVNPDWLPTETVHGPILNGDLTWAASRSGTRRIKTARWINRNAVFRDFFQKTKQHAAPGTTDMTISIPKWVTAPDAVDAAMKRILAELQNRCGQPGSRQRSVRLSKPQPSRR